ncbi:hypothetical protein YC2023_026511 [Brassica napus]
MAQVPRDRASHYLTNQEKGRLVCYKPFGISYLQEEERCHESSPHGSPPPSNLHPLSCCGLFKDLWRSSRAETNEETSNVKGSKQRDLNPKNQFLSLSGKVSEERKIKTERKRKTREDSTSAKAVMDVGVNKSTSHTVYGPRYATWWPYFSANVR